MDDAYHTVKGWIPLVYGLDALAEMVFLEC